MSCDDHWHMRGFRTLSGEVRLFDFSCRASVFHRVISFPCSTSSRGRHYVRKVSVTYFQKVHRVWVWQCKDRISLLLTSFPSLWECSSRLGTLNRRLASAWLGELTRLIVKSKALLVFSSFYDQPRLSCLHDGLVFTLADGSRFLAARAGLVD